MQAVLFYSVVRVFLQVGKYIYSFRIVNRLFSSMLVFILIVFYVFMAVIQLVVVCKQNVHISKGMAAQILHFYWQNIADNQLVSDKSIPAMTRSLFTDFIYGTTDATENAICICSTKKILREVRQLL